MSDTHTNRTKRYSVPNRSHRRILNFMNSFFIWLVVPGWMLFHRLIVILTWRFAPFSVRYEEAFYLGKPLEKPP